MVFLNEGTLCCPGMMLISHKYSVGESLPAAAEIAEDSLQHSQEDKPREALCCFLKIKAATKVKWSVPNPLSQMP